MKLLRCGHPDHEIPAVLDGDGWRRDVSAFTRDFDGRFLNGDGIAALRSWFDEHGQRCPILPEILRLGPPVADIPFVLGVGLNYADHAAESGMAVPAEPVFFVKAPTSVCGPEDDVWLPQGCTHLDYEVELGVVVAKRSYRLDPAAVADHIAGYVIVNDVSERRWQKDRGAGQWTKGKGHERWCPTGPWLVTPDELPSVLTLELDVNGEPRQRGSTDRMVFDPLTIVHHASHCMTLPAGTLIPTGTPPGVAMGMKPPRYLAAGNLIDLRISGLGSQRQRVTEAPL